MFCHFKINHLDIFEVQISFVLDATGVMHGILAPGRRPDFAPLTTIIHVFVCLTWPRVWEPQTLIYFSQRVAALVPRS